MLSLSMKQFIIGEYLAKLQARRSHALCVPDHHTAIDEERAHHNPPFLPINYARYLPILKHFFSLADSAINIA